METDKTLRLRALGLVGVGAAAMMFASDCIIMDSSSSGAEFGRIGLARLTESPNWRLTLGGVTGPIASFFFVIGFVHVYFALRPGGKRLACLCTAGLSLGYVILGAWHAAGPMFAFINRMQPNVSDPMAHEGWTYLANLGFAGFLPAVFSLILLPILMLARKSLYPKWFVILTPGAVYICSMSLFAMAPAPVGGFLVMGCGSLSFLVFFLASTVLLWNCGQAGGVTRENV